MFLSRLVSAALGLMRRTGLIFPAKWLWRQLPGSFTNRISSSGRPIRISDYLGPDYVDEARIVYQLIGSRVGIMVDVGAHNGSALAPFARHGWRVFAFEPSLVNGSVLGERFRGASNVVVDRRAVTDEDDRLLPFYESEVSTGISGLTPFHESHESRGQVRTVKLASWLAETDPGHVNFLKTDVEGHDLPALRGWAWDRDVPDIVLCEFEDRKTAELGYRWTDLVDLLRQQYDRVVVSEWYPVQEYGNRHSWRRFALAPARLADESGWGNLLAFRLESDFDAFVALLGRAGLTLHPSEESSS